MGCQQSAAGGADGVPIAAEVHGKSMGGAGEVHGRSSRGAAEVHGRVTRSDVLLLLISVLWHHAIPSNL